MVGKNLSHYKVLEELGRGGMGMFQRVQYLSGINVSYKMYYFRRATFGLMILMFMTLSAVAQTSFSEQKIIAQSDAFSPTSVFAADLDDDGDQDMLSASFDDDKIAWYENDGNGGFGPQRVITTSADGARSVYAADLDGDGDQDMLSASSGDDKIAWYENDGNGGFGPQQVITTSARGARSVYAADLDGDGDQDVLSASRNGDKIAWYENDGNGGFGPQRVITITTDAAFSVYAADLDGDGDQDVLSASSDDSKIAWYENEGSAMDTDVETASDVLPLEIEIRIFPNPASESLFIQLVGAHAEPYRIGVFDLLGRRVVRTEENTIGGAIESYRLDVSRLAPGMYVVRIEGSSSVYHRLVAVTK